MLYRGSELLDQFERGEFNPLSPAECMEELYTIMENVNLPEDKHCLFRSNHISNYIPLAGTLPKDKNRLLAEIRYSAQELSKLKNWDVYTGIRPSLDVNGIWGGYTEEGTKTVIPSRAYAKISMRLVPDQDFEEIGRLFEEHFRNIAPKSVKVNVKFLHGGAPYVSPTDMEAYKAAEKAIEESLYNVYKFSPDFGGLGRL